MAVSNNIRQELIRLCSRSSTRIAEFSRGAPTHWEPTHGYHPDTGDPFTPASAWEFVRDQLATGCALNRVELDKPRGKIGYWFHFRDARGTRFYVKLQITSGKVIGRSFHEG